MKPPRPRRLVCPVCGDPLDKVADTRQTDLGVRRLRVCLNGHRVTTMELIVILPRAA